MWNSKKQRKQYSHRQPENNDLKEPGPAQHNGHLFDSQAESLPQQLWTCLRFLHLLLFLGFSAFHWRRVHGVGGVRCTTTFEPSPFAHYYPNSVRQCTTVLSREIRQLRLAIQVPARKFIAKIPFSLFLPLRYQSFQTEYPTRWRPISYLRTFMPCQRRHNQAWNTNVRLIRLSRFRYHERSCTGAPTVHRVRSKLSR